MEEKPNYYAIIPADVRYDNSLRANEKLLYGEITALSKQTGECWASNKYFCELYNVKPNAIATWIRHLKEKKYIDVDYEYIGKEIQKRIIRIGGIQKDNTYSQKNMGVFTNEYEGYSQKGEENNTSSINNTSINNKKEIYKEKFEIFYKEYPKHVKRAEVEKWFFKNEPDDELFNTIMEQLKKFKKTKEWKDPQYIPYPSTWLNQKRWEDEIKTKEEIEEEWVEELKREVGEL